MTQHAVINFLGGLLSLMGHNSQTGSNPMYTSLMLLWEAPPEERHLLSNMLADIKAVILEQVKYNEDIYRIERERYLINKLNTFHKGLNREQ